MTAVTLEPLGADRIFAALGDGTRRAIFRLVSAGPQSVSIPVQALGVTLTAVTQHLRDEET